MGIASGVPFLVIELESGGSLESQRARFGDVPWGLRLLRQIAKGLAILHDAGVVHRDLKPANVLLAGAPEAPLAKIADFASRTAHSTMAQASSACPASPRADGPSIRFS